MTTRKLTGGCACGAVRYEVGAEPMGAVQCQCRQCQRATGSGHSSLLLVPSEALIVRGELRFFAQTADSGATVQRGFCPACGSPVLMFSERFPQGRLLAAASLDDPAAYKPQRVVFHDFAQPWDAVDAELLK
jgi:hypothetical protein